MNIPDQTHKFLVRPNALRRLAGREEELKLLENMGNTYFDGIGDDTMSVEIMTLTQYRYELAFEKIIANGHFTSMDIEDMAKQVDDILHEFDNIPPHVSVQEGVITVIMDCGKIDTQIVQYASMLLAELPSMEPGYYWEYLKHGKGD